MPQAPAGSSCTPPGTPGTAPSGSSCTLFFSHPFSSFLILPCPSSFNSSPLPHYSHSPPLPPLPALILTLISFYLPSVPPTPLRPPFLCFPPSSQGAAQDIGKGRGRRLGKGGARGVNGRFLSASFSRKDLVCVGRLRIITEPTEPSTVGELSPH